MLRRTVFSFGGYININKFIYLRLKIFKQQFIIQELKVVSNSDLLHLTSESLYNPNVINQQRAIIVWNTFLKTVNWDFFRDIFKTYNCGVKKMCNFA